MALWGMMEAVVFCAVVVFAVRLGLTAQFEYAILSQREALQSQTSPLRTSERIDCLFRSSLVPQASVQDHRTHRYSLFIVMDFHSILLQLRELPSTPLQAISLRSIGML